MTQLQRAAETGDRKEILKALRVSVWESITDPKTGGRDVAALSKKWIEITNELGEKRRVDFEMLRDVLIEGIEKSNSGRDIAAMSTRLVDVLNELDAIPDAKAEKSPVEKMREMVKRRGTT